MWSYKIESKCPNCGKEYFYDEIVSCSLLINIEEFDYNKNCECGTNFDMSENRINDNSIGFFITQPLSNNIDKYKEKF
jgi:hypothetical protein